jgi:hypothetical protein
MAIVNWPKVLPRDDGIRPAGPQDACFYCDRKIGEEHTRDCSTILKIVRLRYIYEVDVEVPYQWTRENIEFHRNMGTWCSDNSLDELEAEKVKAGCLCSRHTAEFMDVVDDTPIQKPQRLGIVN